MPSKQSYDIIVIGGSAGSIKVVISILHALPDDFPIPIVLVIHRMKNTVSHLDQLIAKDAGKNEVIEPLDKEQILAGNIYLAPQNYHLLVEEDYTFSLDYSEPVYYSRPSIDVSFESFSHIYKHRMLAILLSGANKDGAASIGLVLERGGTAIVQSLETADYVAMPKSAIELNASVLIKSPKEMVNYLTELTR